MKIHGWCTTCHKVKRVQISGSALARPGTPRGICDSCQQAEDDKNKARRAQLSLSDAPRYPPTR